MSLEDRILRVMDKFIKKGKSVECDVEVGGLPIFDYGEGKKTIEEVEALSDTWSITAVRIPEEVALTPLKGRNGICEVSKVTFPAEPWKVSPVNTCSDIVTPVRPVTRLKCRYCESEYSDLSKDKCESCGSSLYIEDIVTKYVPIDEKKKEEKHAAEPVRLKHHRDNYEVQVEWGRYEPNRGLINEK